MDEINGEFARTDVALVIGANDVTNPAARTASDSPIYGMPILDVDKAQLGHRPQALDGVGLRRASTTRCSTTRRPRCCSATRRPRWARCSPRSRTSDVSAAAELDAPRPRAIRPDRDDARVDAEQPRVAASRWRSRSGHFSCVSGSRVGIAQRTQGCRRRSTTPPAKRSAPPSHVGLRPRRRVERRGGGWCGSGAGRAVPELRLERARASPRWSRARCARGPGCRRGRGAGDGAAEVVARARARRRGSPQPQRWPSGAVTVGARRVVRVERRRRRRTGRRARQAQQPRRLARGQRPPRRPCARASPRACGRRRARARPARRRAGARPPST